MLKVGIKDSEALKLEAAPSDMYQPCSYRSIYNRTAKEQLRISKLDHEELLLLLRGLVVLGINGVYRFKEGHSFLISIVRTVRILYVVIR